MHALSTAGVDRAMRTLATVAGVRPVDMHLSVFSGSLVFKVRIHAPPSSPPIDSARAAERLVAKWHAGALRQLGGVRVLHVGLSAPRLHPHHLSASPAELRVPSQRTSSTGT